MDDALNWTIPKWFMFLSRTARNSCSGRECLPFLSRVGRAVKYLETRPPGEVTVFQILDQEGPCQNGAWHDAAPVIFGRLGAADAVVAWPTAKNNTRVRVTASAQ